MEVDTDFSGHMLFLSPKLPTQQRQSTEKNKALTPFTHWHFPFFIHLQIGVERCIITCVLFVLWHWHFINLFLIVLD